MKNIALTLLIFLPACTQSSKEDLQFQSRDTHQLARKIGEHVADKIDRIESLALTFEKPMKSVLLDSVISLRKDFDHWESTVPYAADSVLQRIPGLTPEADLIIQSNLRDRVIQLNIRAQKILDKLRDEDKYEPSRRKTTAPGHIA
ncbi:hypothetical protein E1176_11925 [Fulvivirga sp. RKSG066]|uniref:hypothetical protein n=1 Tax=Fulvivirga aurantia TaxID=2529383 RepID=UPI0012BC98F0|nr:hypothetical protein [Fulvivirga aurantia]MTI21731.1 hypothetical protein [Fulvivirga aurantia]